jgi:hypothetical protein
MPMKRITLCASLLLILACGVFAQRIQGRSGVGSLSTTQMDSTGAPVVPHVRETTFDFEFSEPSGNKFLDPRETGRLRVVVTNAGKSTLRNVVIRVIPLSPPTDVVFNDSIGVGDLPVNATRYAIFYFTAGEGVPSQILTFQIDIHDALGAIADSRLFTILTRERRPN